MGSIFGGGGGSAPPPPQYLPPPPPPPIPTLADYSKSPGADPTNSLMAGMGGTKSKGVLDTEASTTRKSLLGE